MVTGFGLDAIPLATTSIVLAPVSAVCAIAGWVHGGRLPLAITWTAFAIWIVVRSSGAVGFQVELMRGWAVLLAVAFGVVSGAKVARGFLPNALLALALTAIVGGGALSMMPGGLGDATALVSAEIGERASLAARAWQVQMATPEWIRLMQESPGWGSLGKALEEEIPLLPAIALRLFPAMLALQSLSVMALGWAVYHRAGRVRLGPPLAPLRELRFHEALVWGVVAGLVLVALPLSGVARDVGANLLLFFGVLYALRGLGVMIWFLSPGRAMTVALVLVAVLFWPVVVTVSAGLGLGDTWFDWRRASRHRSQRSE